MPDTVTDFKIPKSAVPIELALCGYEMCEVNIYLAEHHAHTWRRQAVLDLLEDDLSFLPARDCRSGVGMIFNKEMVVWIGVPLPVRATGQEPEEGEELFDRCHEVRLEMEGKRSLEGQLFYSAPPERARVVDYLNGHGRFFRLWRKDHVYLVNKRFLLRVVERDDPRAGR